jgi:hypothetical protein
LDGVEDDSREVASLLFLVGITEHVNGKGIEPCGDLVGTRRIKRIYDTVERVKGHDSPPLWPD